MIVVNIIKIGKDMFKKNKPYEATETDVITYSKLYNIPMDIVRIIYSQKRDWGHFFNIFWFPSAKQRTKLKDATGLCWTERTKNVLVGRFLYEICMGRVG